jgi:hypothetical protein
MRKIAGLAAVLALTLGLLLVVTRSETGAAGPNVITVQGVTDVGGHKTFVEIVLAVPPGKSAQAIADEALAAQGARRPQPADYTTEGFIWPQFTDSYSTNDFVEQYYNPANEPTSASQALNNSENTWSSVSSSYFKFRFGGTTERCPSLVRECPGPQTYDGNNDVAWLAIGGCCTLGVTWYGTGPYGPEADMALNTKFTWSTSGSGGYDIETVFLHENGHVAGLGHSDDPTAVMYPSYHGVLHDLQCDDIEGITSLYPNGVANCGTLTPTQAATSTPTTPTPTPSGGTTTPTATSTPAPTKCPPGNPNGGRCR